MLKHNGEAYSVNAGESDSLLDLHLDIEEAVDRLEMVTLMHGQLLSGQEALIDALEVERLELSGAQELMGLLRQMRHE